MNRHFDEVVAGLQNYEISKKKPLTGITKYINNNRKFYDLFIVYKIFWKELIGIGYAECLTSFPKGKCEVLKRVSNKSNNYLRLTIKGKSNIEDIPRIVAISICHAVIHKYFKHPISSKILNIDKIDEFIKVSPHIFLQYLFDKINRSEKYNSTLNVISEKLIKCGYFYLKDIANEYSVIQYNSEFICVKRAALKHKYMKAMMKLIEKELKKYE